MEANKKFVTVINCMDGRVQDAINNYMKSNFRADFVDVITEPGPVKILADKAPETVIEDIKKCLEISAKKHASEILAIVAHHDCAGNPLPKEEQVKQLALAKETAESFGLFKEIILLWVEGDWATVEKI